MGIFIYLVSMILFIDNDIFTGGLSKGFFLGTVLFLIFIMIMILYIKILNSKANKKAGKEN
jgi:hypothetical protein